MYVRSTSMAAASSQGFGHEMYTYPPDVTAASCLFPPPDFVAGNDVCGTTTTMSFLQQQPVNMTDVDYFPVLGGHLPDYHASPPPQVFGAENEMNMSFVEDDGRRRRVMSGGAAGAGSGGHRPSSRIGFRMRSEVDALDDGFKWRKYGKKAVKGSPNPRNYYRCSTEGCGVKKLIERDRDDPRYVVTTYDGVHNHAAPAPAAGRGVAAVHRATPRPPSVVDDVWGAGATQLRAAAATAHSSESSYS